MVDTIGKFNHQKSSTAPNLTCLNALGQYHKSLWCWNNSNLNATARSVGAQAVHVFCNLQKINFQAGCDSGHPGLVAGDPAHNRGVETRWSLRCFSTQAILWVLWICERILKPMELNQANHNSHVKNGFVWKQPQWVKTRNPPNLLYFLQQHL